MESLDNMHWLSSFLYHLTNAMWFLPVLMVEGVSHVGKSHSGRIWETVTEAFLQRKPFTIERSCRLKSVHTGRLVLSVTGKNTS